MSYIGKIPTIGNFVKLDAITTSSTNTYNLTLDSVAFSPESPNHCLVSLNGVIQAPTTSFSISGSTITFIPSSGTLASSDSIDFIMVYGNVLDLGVPSDATVTNAKTNFVSTSSAAGLQIKGDGTTDGTLQLNCSQNSHGVKIKSPAHSASASYTLTLPTTDGSADEFLKTDGSGVLSWASAGGGGKIAQVVYQNFTTSFTTPTATYADTGLTLAITPTASNSKLYIQVFANGVQHNGNSFMGMKMFEDSTELEEWEKVHAYSDNTASSVVLNYQRDASSTSARTYKIQAANSPNTSGSIRINNIVADGGSCQSSMMIMEVLA